MGADGWITLYYADKWDAYFPGEKPGRDAYCYEVTIEDKRYYSVYADNQYHSHTDTDFLRHICEGPYMNPDGSDPTEEQQRLARAQLAKVEECLAASWECWT